MTWPIAAKLRYIDETLSWLADYRRRCDDPGELLRIHTAIDGWLDERIGLMRRAERLGLAGGPQEPSSVA
ncbi:hypothetical protein [Jiangella alkaliphila]|uniref:Uncharacterized protein n=1 Tax=Jiangella alkaliphila TaxID=419479 RepID=A0A1H2KXR1_9ACTN|nr:hypothetical protein [Jiangella alkaliphila]SDU73523.1 hypothetical protein SAMN04488563_4556 [Jiangella alkaliphila]